MTIEIAHDWVDYVQAGGVLVSLLLAGGALVYSRRSARASADSAQAAADTATAAAAQAEQTGELLRIASDQHKRLVREASRRPVFATPRLEWESSIRRDSLSLRQHFQVRDNSLSGVGFGPQEIFWTVVLRAVFENVGDKSADQALARIMVPEPVTMWVSSSEGEHPQDVDRQEEELDLLGPDGAVGSFAHGWRIGVLPPGQPERTHFLLAFPGAGGWEVRLQARHEEAESVEARFLVTVSETDPDALEPAEVERLS